MVSAEELATVAAPEATATWFPVKHSVVIDTVQKTLESSGFSINKAQYALSRADARMFATLDLISTLAEGVSLAVGIRNSVDKSLPLGFCAGNRVFVCDNLAFRSELLVTRKHTRFGAVRFEEAIALATKALQQFKEVETKRIERLRSLELGDRQADSILLRAFEQGVVSNRLLPTVIKEWRNPSFEDFKERTAWSLLNSFTTAMGGRMQTNPQQFAGLTMRLHELFDRELQLAV
jgi:hypothetical protein